MCCIGDVGELGVVTPLLLVNIVRPLSDKETDSDFSRIEYRYCLTR